MSSSPALLSGTAAETAMRLRQGANPVQAAAPVRAIGAGGSEPDAFAKLLQDSREASKAPGKEASRAPEAPPQPGPGAAASENDRPAGKLFTAAENSPAGTGKQAEGEAPPKPIRQPPIQPKMEALPQGPDQGAGVRRLWPDTRSHMLPSPATPAPGDPAESIDPPIDTLMQARKSVRGGEQETKFDPTAAETVPQDPRPTRMPPLVECPYEHQLLGLHGNSAQGGELEPAAGMDSTQAAASAGMQDKAAEQQLAARADKAQQAEGAWAAAAEDKRIAQAAAAETAADTSMQARAEASQSAPAAAAGGRPAEASAPPAAALAQLNGLAASAGAGSTQASSTPTGATAQAQLQAPPGSAGFAGQLATRLSIWVRGGVQQAQLLLNPAELGPVQVSIAMEGSAAQVRLVAEHAATRQALEQALPTLASQLAQDGLSLAGGGVFDQAAQPREQAQGRDSAATGARQPEQQMAPAPRAPAERRGLLDLVA